MSSDFHTDIPYHSAATAATLNAPLGELDEALGDLSDAVGLGASPVAPTAGEVLTGTGAGTSEWLPPFDRVHDHSNALDGTVVSPTSLNVSGEISPATITANVNNYNPNGGDAAFCWLLLGDNLGNYNITGIHSPAATGALHWLTNTSATTILTLKHNSSSSTAGYRFLLPSNADMALGPGDSALIRYSAAQAAWLVIGL